MGATKEQIATEIVDGIEAFLNDRRGYHIDCLDDDIRTEFLADLKRDVLKVLKRN